MKVLVTGPESSGTRWLTDLLNEAGAEALHRSVPEGPDWLDLVAMARDFDAVVVIVRSERAHLRSLEERIPEITGPTAAEVRRLRALASIAPLLGRSDVHLVSYEAMASEVEAQYLLCRLGLDPSASSRSRWVNANDNRNADRAVPIGWKIEWWTEDDVYQPHLVEDPDHA